MDKPFSEDFYEQLVPQTHFYSAVCIALNVTRAHSYPSDQAMSNPFLGRSAIIDAIKSKERTNAKQKREGLADHPVRFTICGCPDPNCAGWHTIETDRKIPSADDCADILKADNKARKSRKLKRA